MTYLLIIFILLVALAPIVWMKQSPRQQKIAQFRSAATKQGISVALASAPDAREGEVYLNKAKYTCHWLEGADKPVIDFQWLLVKGSRRGDSSQWGGWTWLGKPALTQQLALIESCIDNLSDDVCGLSADSTGVTFFWSEKGDTADLDGNLVALKKLQKQLLD